MLSIIETRRTDEDTYEAISYDIDLDGTVIGWASVIDGEGSPAYIERIDIEEAFRNQGHGSEAINAISDLFCGVIIAPDNEDAQRLYDRLGREYNGDVADYLDQGFGVYMI